MSIHGAASCPDGFEDGFEQELSPVAITRFAGTLAQPGLDEQSEHLQAIQLREALDDAMPALIQAGISHQLRSSRTQRGAELIQSVLADVESLVR